MAVRPATTSDLAHLYPLFARATAPLMHGFPLTPEEFCSAFSRPHRHLGATTLLVAEGHCGTVGLLRVGLYRSTPDRWTLAANRDGLMFGPFVDPREPASAASAANDLIRAGAAWLRERGAARALAFDPVEAVGAPSFNGGWCSLSERLPAVVQAYARAGFRVLHRELCLTRPDLPADVAPPPPQRYSLIEQTRDRDRHALRLYCQGTYAGGCHFSRMFPVRSGRPEAARTGYIDGLAVMESFRGKGLGRLLMLHALDRLRRLGCGPVSLTTNSDNYRAQNLYFSLGFALTDSCVVLALPLGDAEPRRRQ